jgi:glycosyltransferase involved in cell wall biosynthesis
MLRSAGSRNGVSTRLKVLIFNQYYWPGVEATARLLTQLCEELAKDHDVTVVTGRLHEAAEQRAHIVRHGVRIVRVPSTAFDRRILAARAVNYATFLANSLWAGMNAGRPDVVLCMTDPPMLSSIALPVARCFRAPLVIVNQDVFPEIAVQLGRLEQPLVAEALRRAIRYPLVRADAIVAIGETMRTRLEAKGAPADRIEVIPNWANTAQIGPAPHANGWARANGFEGRFVVMHSGNVGYAQDLDTLIRASTLLRDLERLSLVVVGDGARREVLAGLVARVEADAVQFLPYQPDEIVSQSLSSAAVHYVGLARGLSGYVVPSRVYGIMAAGRPMIVSAEADSETARLVAELGCGVVVPPGRVDLVARAIREAAEGVHDLDEMGRRGREYVLREGTSEVAVGRYRRLLAGLAAR